MSIRRAGRTASAARRSDHLPVPSPVPAPCGGGFSTARRRAALGHPGHAVSEAPGFDGEVSVRYEAVYRRAEPASGERRLLLAVLEDGIRTLLKHAHATHGRALNLRREAFTWLTANAEADVFSFMNICETLGIDSDRLRQRVLAEAMPGVPSRTMH